MLELPKDDYLIKEDNDSNIYQDFKDILNDIKINLQNNNIINSKFGTLIKITKFLYKNFDIEIKNLYKSLLVIEKEFYEDEYTGFKNENENENNKMEIVSNNNNNNLGIKTPDSFIIVNELKNNINKNEIIFNRISPIKDKNN